MPTTRPAVHYATTADGLEIAYQVLGDGPFDVVIVPGMSANLDWNAECPFYGGYVRRFPRFARTIVLDKRGGGASDREVGSGSAEDRMDDVRAVMDAVGCERAALVGQLEGGTIAILFAATYPERVSALVLVSTSARMSPAPTGEVLVSSTVRDLVVGSGLEFDDRGEHELRGVAGAWRLLAARAGC
jgi:pimeloyl-ACP methyl ester carboxylesterase